MDSCLQRVELINVQFVLSVLITFDPINLAHKYFASISNTYRCIASNYLKSFATVPEIKENTLSIVVKIRITRTVIRNYYIESVFSDLADFSSWEARKKISSIQYKR